MEAFTPIVEQDADPRRESVCNVQNDLVILSSTYYKVKAKYLLSAVL